MESEALADMVRKQQKLEEEVLSRQRELELQIAEAAAAATSPMANKALRGGGSSELTNSVIHQQSTSQEGPIKRDAVRESGVSEVEVVEGVVSELAVDLRGPMNEKEEEVWSLDAKHRQKENDPTAVLFTSSEAGTAVGADGQV